MAQSIEDAPFQIWQEKISLGQLFEG